MMKVYLDVCCINRPFDDQSQDRIRLEAESVRILLHQVKIGQLIWVGSSVVFFELMQNKDQERKEKMLSLIAPMSEMIMIDQEDIQRAEDLEKMGFGAMDALHLAAAERLTADIFFTVDDRLLRNGRRYKKKLKVKVLSPITYWTEGESDDTD